MPVTINVQSLKETRKDVQNKLIRRLSPELYKAFAQIYDDAAQSPEDTEDFFIELMEEVCEWPSVCPELIASETTTILQKIPQLETYLRIILVSHVMCVSVIRFGEKPEGIDVEVPPADEFVHAIYCQLADQFSADPTLLDKCGSKRQVKSRQLKALRLIRDQIAIVLSDMLPTDQVIGDYLQDFLDGTCYDSDDEEELAADEDIGLIESKEDEPLKLTGQDIPEILAAPVPESSTSPAESKKITISKDHWEPQENEDEHLLEGISEEDL